MSFGPSLLLAAALLGAAPSALPDGSPASLPGGSPASLPDLTPSALPGGTQATPADTAVALPDARRVGLEEAVEIALRRSPSLDAARAGLDEARSNRLAAWGEFLPSLELGYGYATSSTGRLDPTGQAITNTSYSLQLTASYDLFSGFRRFKDLDAAGERSEAADAATEEERYRVVLETKAAFFGAIRSRELAHVEEDRVRRQEAQLDSVRLQLELGRMARTDLLRSRVGLNNARLALLRARNAARASTFRLARTLGLEEPVAPAEGASLEIRPLASNRERLRSAALRAGPSLLRARAEAEAAGAEVWSARSAYLPELRFSGGYAWRNDEFPPDRRSWQIFVFGSYPLFNGFRRENRVGVAAARARAARAEERRAELELRAAVDSAWGVVESAREAVELARGTVELARRELEMRRELLTLGRGSVIDLQDAQISLRQAEADLVQARFDYHLGVAQLEYLVGDELERAGEAAGRAAPESDEGASPAGTTGE